MKPVMGPIAMRRVGLGLRALGHCAPGSFYFHDPTYFAFVDPYGEWRAVPITTTKPPPRGWWWNGDEALPTLTPSIRIVDPEGWHGFITEGVMLSCSDSGNQAVPQ
ncbi:MAG: DUF6527 family protein [Gemmatimonadaceae bacterium]